MQRFFWELQLTVTYSNLRFSKHVTYHCATSNCKLHALSCVSQYISLDKPYYPLMCMTHSRGINNKTNHIHERAHIHFSTPFEGLLAKDKSVTIHNQSLQQLATETFKVKMGISPIIMKKVFNFSDKNS